MCEQATAEDVLKRIPFAVSSVAEKCTERGSYEREIANRVAAAVRHDIEWCLERLKQQNKNL